MNSLIKQNKVVQYYQALIPKSRNFQVRCSLCSKQYYSVFIARLLKKDWIKHAHKMCLKCFVFALFTLLLWINLTWVFKRRLKSEKGLIYADNLRQEQLVILVKCVLPYKRLPKVNHLKFPSFPFNGLNEFEFKNELEWNEITEQFSILKQHFYAASGFKCCTETLITS